MGCDGEGGEGGKITDQHLETQHFISSVHIFLLYIFYKKIHVRRCWLKRRRNTARWRRGALLWEPWPIAWSLFRYSNNLFWIRNRPLSSGTLKYFLSYVRSERNNGKVGPADSFVGNMNVLYLVTSEATVTSWPFFYIKLCLLSEYLFLVLRIRLITSMRIQIFI